jgi:hypothetical protein
LLAATKNGAVSLGEAEQIVAAAAASGRGPDSPCRGFVPATLPVVEAQQIVAAAANDTPVQNGESNGASASGRDPRNGRFTEGNKAAVKRANPHARAQVQMRAAFNTIVDPERFQRIAGKLADLAESGDIEAIKLVFAYQLGRPRIAPDADRLDLDEFRLLDSWPTFAEVMRAVVDSVDPAAALARLAEEMKKTFQERVEKKSGDVLVAQTLHERDKRAGRKRRF